MEPKVLIWAAIVGLALLTTSCERKSKPHSVSGTIETDEVRVASRYGGRVEKLFAQEGDSLKPGQPIAELDAAELRARRDQTAAQLAELEAGPRKEEMEAAKHDWEAISAELEQARADADRAERLFAEKTISPTEREQAVTRARTLERNAAASKSRYDLLLAGTRPERLTQARAQRAELDAQLREMKILAPSDCVLEVLSVKVGDVLPANREIATLLLPQHLWVRVYVPEPWLGHIQINEPVKVRVDSDPEKDFSGTVEQIAREAEFTPRNVQTVGERVKQVFGIKVRLDNSEGKLRAGMAADVTFPGVPQ
ncbi:MAG TPA: efflux RND transporter periplasmic adaptor subunit [Candidatus Dormibacteraeota bacterium]|nr:efflux RND transporter periplasmic adaptor subunit [Candidatus Dormibacteraeota bacterium]